MKNGVKSDLFKHISHKKTNNCLILLCKWWLEY